MKQVMNYNKDNGLLNMIRRTDPMIDGSLQKYSPSTGIISILSNEMPSDYNDPNRMNLIDVKERHPASTIDILRYQQNINKGILNSKIK